MKVERLSKAIEKSRKNHKSWGSILKERMAAVLKYGGSEILDVGCATGEYVKFLNSRGFSAYGCDLLDYHWKGKLKNRFKVADINKLPYKDNSFDTVLAFEVIEHQSNPRKALSELHRVARNNIIISVPNCEEPESFRKSGLTFSHFNDKSHKHFFLKKDIIRLVENSKFKVTLFKYVNPIRPDLLVCDIWNIPTKIGVLFERITSRIPFKKKYFMTLLLVAKKL